MAGIARVLVVLGGILLSAAASAQDCLSTSIYELQKDCTATLKQPTFFGAYTSIRGPGVIDPRIPALPKLPEGMPASCSAPLKTKRDGWRHGDICNWEELSNHYCSHLLGWREKVPNTCKAGGPPPLCPEDHWIQDAARSLSELEEEQAKVTRGRAAELLQDVSAACECWATAIDKEADTQSQKVVEQLRVRPDAAGGIVLSACSALGCPPGYLCLQDKCVRKTLVDTSKEVFTSLAMDQLQSLVTDRPLEALRELLRLSTYEFEVLIRMLESTSIAFEHEVYNGQAKQYLKKLDAIRPLMQEYDNAVRSQPARAIGDVRKDLSKAHAELTEEFALLSRTSGAYLGELRPNQCPRVFHARHRRVAAIHARLNDVLVGMTRP